MNRAGRDVAEFYPALRRLATGAGSASEIDRFGRALRNLQRGLTGDRPLAGASYFSSADYLGAYLLYYWPVSFVQVSLALEEVRLRGALPRIRRVLDIGAGPGPASFAAAGFGAWESGAVDCTLVDANGEALDAAMRLKGASGARVSMEFKPVRRNLEEDDSFDGIGPLDDTNGRHGDDRRDGDDGRNGAPYDLIVACHSANELWKGRDDAIERRASLFVKASAFLAEGGILLIVEPSANVTGRPALELRDRLLAEEQRFSCVAPCPGSFPCPIAAAGEGRGCHSTWPWEPNGPVATLARAAGLDRDSAKATWFALKKSVSPRLEERAAPAQPGGRLAGRIVSESMLNKAGRLRYIMCTGSGLATLSAKAEGGAQGKGTATGGTAEAAKFFSLKRGDLVEAEGLERRVGENSFGFMPVSRLRITMKAPEA